MKNTFIILIALSLLSTTARADMGMNILLSQVENAESIDPNMLNFAFMIADVNKDSKVSKEEALQLAEKMYDIAGNEYQAKINKSELVTEVNKAFALYDANKDGFMSTKDIDIYWDKIK